ncbi:MAG: transcriptional regulator [archaeon]|nr:transcriptional regulator [archaeon]
MTVQDLISNMLREEGGFQKAFKDILDNELKISLNEFCHLAGVSQSTMYKILEERREPNLRTVRHIIKALNTVHNRNSDKYIAVIASATFIQGLPKTLETEANGNVIIREYAVSTVEDAIIAAVRAERDGALGVICAPIVANTVEKILSVPVYPVYPLDSVLKILEQVKSKY